MLKRTWDAAMQSIDVLSPRKIQPYPSPGGRLDSSCPAMGSSSTIWGEKLDALSERNLVWVGTNNQTRTSVSGCKIICSGLVYNI